MRGQAFARDEGGNAWWAHDQPPVPRGASLNIFPIRTLGQCRSVAPAALFYPNSELKSALISWTIWTVTQMLKPVGAAILLCVYYTSIQYYFSTKTSEFMKSFPKKNQKLNPYQCIANQCKICSMIWSLSIFYAHTHKSRRYIYSNFGGGYYLTLLCTKSAWTFFARYLLFAIFASSWWKSREEN